ncbi:hypothetical protein KIV63_gp13 [Mycobacterium phage SWU2]|uniref:Uncharacterized protein n=1 Tax=Mycobacterium phage SWU2 TaxID=2077150 RepID=A0A2K9VI54_9CAUD|nr:hypothetical protein KIV63_gp13 [Mycobacterium phage SWU2]AUV62031.1 hypothetical protein JX_gp72 [Mycobacterium phage SWU2]
MNIKQAIIPNASTDPLGRALALIVTPDGWEYVLQSDL